MPIPLPSEKEILNRVFNRIKAEIPSISDRDSSIFGMIARIIAAEIYEARLAVVQVDRSSDPYTATGSDLDEFGLLFGVPRKNAANASTKGLTRAVRFTNLGNAPVTIPSGVRVSKSTNPQLAFFTTEGVTVNAGQYGDVHVTADASGEVYNAAVGELDIHSYTDSSIIVTNFMPIQNGQSLETDDAYRERLIQDIRRRDVLNLSNTDALLRQVPGVRDIFILNKYRGAGTFDAIVIPYNQSALQQVVQECNTLLAQYMPIGISAVARGPRYRQLDVRVNIKFSKDSTDKRDLIRESIKAQIAARIDNLPLETGSGLGTFQTSQITGIALSTDPAILSASISLGLDGAPLSNDGEIRLNTGERLVLRSLAVT